jgi:hypothetical protein
VMQGWTLQLAMSSAVMKARIARRGLAEPWVD